MLEDIRNIVLQASQPITASEIGRAMMVFSGRTVHITTMYKLLGTLLEQNIIFSRYETDAERELRHGNRQAKGRSAYLYWHQPLIPTRTEQNVLVLGSRASSRIPSQIVRKKKSRPAYNKKVQTGTTSMNSRPAYSNVVQTGHLAEIDRLSLRVAELELTIEMLRRVLDSSSTI
jgi:hypothetical protein